MKKIYTRTVFEFNPKTNKYEVNEKESHYHYIDDDAPIAQMKGGMQPTQVQRTDPWRPVQPYLRDADRAALDAFLTPDNVNNPTNQLAPGLLDDTLQGKYLYGGEGFNAALDAARNKILPDVESRFARGGRGGSGLAATAEAGALGDAFAGLYNNERERQMQAAQLAPNVSQMRYETGDRRRAMIAELIKLLSGQGSMTTNLAPNNEMSPWAKYYLASTGGALQGAAVGGVPGAVAGGGLGLLQAYAGR